MVDQSRLRELLDELRFDEALEMLDNDGDPSLGTEIAARRADAGKQAEVVAQRLIDLGAKGNLDEFLVMIDDPVNQRLTPLASPSARGRLDVYVQEAERWRKHQVAVNERRLREARQALEGLDFRLAEGLVRKLDEQFLSDDSREERDRILLEMSARAMEVEALAKSDDLKKQPRRPGRRTRKRRRR